MADDDMVHGQMLTMLGIKNSYSMQRHMLGLPLSPRDDALADLEEAALSAVLKFKRCYELMQK